jgi:hypothetical protein
MSRLEHVVQVGAAMKQTAPTPTPTPTAVLPIRQLPDDLLAKIFSADLQNVPIENLCATLYERCLLVRGSGSCPPDDPFWEEACRRLGLPQAGYVPFRGGDVFSAPPSWMYTFREFCVDLSESPDYARKMIWLCLQGRADEIDEEDEEQAYGDMQRDESSIPEMVVTVLKHYGIDVEPPADDYDDYAPGGWHYDRL